MHRCAQPWRLGHTRINFVAKSVGRRSVVTDDLLLSASIAHQVCGSTHEELVEAIRSSGLVRHENAMEALAAVDRAKFVSSSSSSSSSVYSNSPTLLCSATGATMSAPAHHAQTLDLVADLLQSEGASCLEVGSGTGVLCALLAHAGASRVRGLELNPLLHERALEIAAATHTAPACLEFECVNAMLELKRAFMEPQFDVIVVTPCVEDEGELKAIAAAHLREGGRLVGAVGPGGKEQRLVTWDNTGPDDGGLRRTELHAVLCQAMLSHKSGEELLRAAESGASDGVGEQFGKRSQAEELADVQGRLADWKAAFTEEQGRAPSREDMMADEEAKSLFTLFASLRKRVW